VNKQICATKVAQFAFHQSNYARNVVAPMAPRHCWHVIEIKFNAFGIIFRGYQQSPVAAPHHRDLRLERNRRRQNDPSL